MTMKAEGRSWPPGEGRVARALGRGWSVPLSGIGWKVAASFVVRIACYAASLWLSLIAEARVAPTLYDAVLEAIPLMPSVARYNYLLWLAAYVPVSLWFLRTDARRFVRYMYVSGGVALLRGFCILATGLGPVYGHDSHVGLTYAERSRAFWQLLNPLEFFAPSAGARIYLTKDLFFSGHTATTLLLLLYVWPYRWLRYWMLLGHLLVVASVFLSHLHYTIDVIGAYAVTFACFALCEWRPRPIETA